MTSWGSKLAKKILPTEKEMRFLLVRADKTRSKNFEIRPFCSNPAIWEASEKHSLGQNKKVVSPGSIVLRKWPLKCCCLFQVFWCSGLHISGTTQGIFAKLADKLQRTTKSIFAMSISASTCRFRHHKGHFGRPSEHLLTQPKRGIAFIHSFTMSLSKSSQLPVVIILF